MKVALATPAGRARLDRRRADLVVGDAVKNLREAVHALFEQRLQRLRRDVAAGEAGAAGGDDDVDRPGRRSRRAPWRGSSPRRRDDLPGGETMAGLGDPLRRACRPTCRRRGVRVSETVSTAMRTGMNWRSVSADMRALPLSGPLSQGGRAGSALLDRRFASRGPASSRPRRAGRARQSPGWPCGGSGTVWKASRTFSGIGARR